MKKLSVIKRAVPVLASAIAVSVLYTSYSFAGTNNIPYSDIMLGDTLEIGAGYYEDATVINIPTKEQVIARNEINIDDLVDNNAVQGISSIAASYYSGGNNDTLNVGLTSTSGNKNVTLSATGPSTLNLGVNESITLPTGYYAHDVVIKNGVANRGSAPIILTSGMRHFSLAEGYYSNIEVTADISNLSNGEITYFIGHKHTGNSTGGGCYTEVISSYSATHSHNWRGTGHYSGSAEYFECTNCGRGLYPQFNDWNFPNVPCSTYTVYVYGPGCGYEEGEIVRTTTNYTELNSLTANEVLSKVEIVY